MKNYPYSVRMASVLTLFCCLMGLSRAQPVEDVVAYVQNEIESGNRMIIVPTGVYRLEQRDRTFFTFNGIKDVTIDFGGSMLVGLSTTGMFDIRNCENLTIRNVKIDYDPLPFTQAVIEEKDADSTWTVRILDGYPTEDVVTHSDVAMRIQVYSAVSGELINPLRYGDHTSLTRIDNNHYRISGGVDRRGNVGDFVVFSRRKYDPRFGYSQAVVDSQDCKYLRFENVSIFSSPEMGFVENGNTRSTYDRCVMDRLPPELETVVRELPRLRSLNVDAFHCKDAVVGPQILGCTARYMADDCVNISGMFSMVMGSSGDVLRIAPSSHRGLGIAPGDELEILTLEGKSIKGLTVLAVESEGRITDEELALIQTLNLVDFYKDPNRSELKQAYRLQLSDSIALNFGDVVISANRVGNGFRIIGNTFGPIRSRPILIKASHGLIANNTLVGAIHAGAIQIGPEYFYLEGAAGSDIRITNNIMMDGKVPAVFIGGNLGRNYKLPASTRSNIYIGGNEVRRSSAPAVRVTGLTNLAIEDNSFDLIGPNGGGVVVLTNTEDFTFENNTVKWTDRLDN